MDKNLLTIRQCAKLGIANEHFIRELVRKNKCPGIQWGNRFYVHVGQLQKQLDKYSMEATNNEHQDEQQGTKNKENKSH